MSQDAQAATALGGRCRRKDARPAEILAAALALFAERGFATTRLEDVARAAGISKGTVFLYFPTKEDLFRAVVRHELVPNIAALEAEAARHEGSSGTLLRLIAGRLAGILDSELGAIPKLVICEAGTMPEIARFYAEEVAGRGMRLFGAVLRRGVACGEFRPVDPMHVIPSFIGAVMLMLLWRHSIGRHTEIAFDHHAVLDAHLDLFLRGLAPDQPA